MATPTKNQAAIDTAAQLDDLINAANAKFIAMTDIAQADQIALGKSFVTVNLFEYVDFAYIANYYMNLGYGVIAPNCNTYWRGCPANLFGPYWEAYWAGKLICGCKKPCKISISWK